MHLYKRLDDSTFIRLDTDTEEYKIVPRSSIGGGLVEIDEEELSCKLPTEKVRLAFDTVGRNDNRSRAVAPNSVPPARKPNAAAKNSTPPIAKKAVSVAPPGHEFLGAVPPGHKLAYEDRVRGIRVAVDRKGRRHTCISPEASARAAERLGETILNELYSIFFDGDMDSQAIGHLYHKVKCNHAKITEGEFLHALHHMDGRHLKSEPHIDPVGYLPLCEGGNPHSCTLWRKGVPLHHWSMRTLPVPIPTVMSGFR
jgi:hypothetical protein